MIKSEFEMNGKLVCDLSYLTELMEGKAKLIVGIMDAFLEQIPDELFHLKNAIMKTDYATIKNYAHTMKSSVSIMGISVLIPILQEMEDLGTNAISIKTIKELNKKLILLCNQAIEEIKKEKQKFI